MTKFIPLNKAEHASARWRRPTSYAFAATQAVAPIASAEVAKAAANMPLGFIRREGAVLLVALLSLVPGKNAFVGPNGKWLGAYIPAVFRGYPFQLVRIEGRDDYALCIAEGQAVSGGEGEPLYDEAGELSKPTAEILNFLNALEASRRQMMEAAASLERVGVLAEWPIKVRDASNRENTVGGVLRVDEQALNGLGDEAYLSLRRSGALALAYAHLISMQRLEVLGRLPELATRLAQPQKKELDLGFLREDDGSIVF